MNNILLVEDDKNIRQLLKIRLENEGYIVTPARDGREALSIFEESANKFDLLIVDIMMPHMNGFEFIDSVRAYKKNIPTIIISAKDNVQDKTRGFSIGIDDYMVKPIEFEELRWRIKAILRRAKIVSERKIVIGALVIDYDSLSLNNGKHSVILTKREFELLFKLLSYPDRAFTKEQLFEEFWEIDSPADDSIIKVMISKIRNKTADFSEISIATIRGLGYKGIRNE